MSNLQVIIHLKLYDNDTIHKMIFFHSILIHTRSSAMEFFVLKIVVICRLF